MTFEYKIEEVAASQLLEAMLWYEGGRQGLGDELFLCFEEAVKVICRNPYYEDRYNGIRLYNIHRFPYQVVYKIEPELITDIAFFQAKRDPRRWKKL